MTVCPECNHEFDVAVQWPPGVFEEAMKVFGPSLQNEGGRTRKTLNGKIEWCLREWGKRYGDPLNVDQLEYAGRVLVRAIQVGFREAGGAPTVYPFVYATIDRMRNHEIVHAGMKQRAGFVPTGDVHAMIREGIQ